MVRRIRKYRKAYSRSFKTMKYSNETFSATMDAYNLQAGGQVGIVFTQGTSVLGTRKAKNFTLSLATSSSIPFQFALVFVPEGTEPSLMNIGTETSGAFLISDSVYEPNQNVILSGLFGGPDQQIYRFKTRLARNLNSGDKILLVVRPIQRTEESTLVTVTAHLNYAISY